MSSRASWAASRVSATTSATHSPTKRTRLTAITGRSGTTVPGTTQLGLMLPYGAPERLLLHGGTDSSNLLSSSAESATRLYPQSFSQPARWDYARCGVGTAGRRRTGLGWARLWGMGRRRRRGKRWSAMGSEARG